MKQTIFLIFNLLLCFLCLVCCYEQKRYTDRRASELERALATVCVRVQAQDGKIDKAEQHCDDVARCIIEGAW